MLEETAEQQNSTNVLPTISIQAQKKTPLLMSQQKQNSALKYQMHLYLNCSIQFLSSLREQLDQNKQEL